MIPLREGEGRVLFFLHPNAEATASVRPFTSNGCEFAKGRQPDLTVDKVSVDYDAGEQVPTRRDGILSI